MLIEGMMGGIELAKYDGIDFTPPQGARDAAKRALDVREGKPASQRGMTPVGIARARDLQNGVKMSPDTVRRMKAFFDRHEVDKKGATWDEQGKGWQAWNGWGGDAGYAWARKVVGQMEARDKKTEFVAGRDCGQDEGGTFGPDNKCAEGYGRPPLKGGYTPTRPGGKFPKDYKRPTPQGEKEKPKKQKDTTPPPPPPKLPEPPKQKERSPEEKRRDEITNTFKDAGIEANIPENIDRANDIEKSFKNLKDKGYDIPPPERILTADLGEKYGSAFAGSFAVATTGQDGKSEMIFDVQYNKSGDGLANQLDDLVEDKYFSSKDIFVHEYAHNAHGKAIGIEQWTSHIKNGFGSGQKADKEILIAGKVSTYAAKDPLEFVAEVFSGHVNGESYDKDVYELYKKYKGPKLL
jgi:general stress protein YciG